MFDTSPLFCINDSDREKLLFIQDKLQNSTISLKIRILSYLRICCTLLDNAQHAADADDIYLPSYVELLNQLCQISLRWWELCYVTDQGKLRSTHPHVDQLLHPLSRLE